MKSKHRTQMLRIGCSSGAFYPATPTEETIDIAARIGIDVMEVMLQTVGEYDPAFIQALAQRARAAGIEIHSVHTMHQLHPVFDAYPRRVEEAWHRFEQAAEAAKELGARVLVWHGACRDDGRDGPASDHHLAALDRLASICADRGIMLGLENVSWCAMSQTRDVLAITPRLRELDHGDAIGFTFDVFQAAEAGANPFMVLAAMEDRLVNVHLREQRQDDPSARSLMPGEGELPWPAILRAIARTGYRGPLILEGALGDDPAASMSAARALLEPLIADAVAGETTCDSTMPLGLATGIELFNRGKYYECHEEIEHEWHAERGEIRRLYQGILQIGVGLHHARSGNQRGAILLLTDGIAKVSHFLPTCLGIDTASLLTTSQSCLDRIAQAEPDSVAQVFDTLNLPTISPAPPL